MKTYTIVTTKTSLKRFANRADRQYYSKPRPVTPVYGPERGGLRPNMMRVVEPRCGSFLIDLTSRDIVIRKAA